MGKVVPLQEPQDTHERALDQLVELVGDDLKKVNAAILARMDSSVPMIPQLAGHLISAGGKRLRPLLTLASAQMCGYEGDGHIGLAACVEFIHTATLLHDDVVDESEMRRGSESANMLWGNQAPVLVGDFLFSRSFQIMVEHGSLEVLRILADASAVMAEGEVLQLAAANDLETTEDAYLQVVTAKTATLFAAACEIGAVIAGRPARETQALQSYGRNLGIAFQLVDDVLDYSAKQQTLGKTIGDDFREGKITLPLVLAYRRGKAEERAFWERTIEGLEQQDDDLQTALSYMAEHGALEDAVARAQHYGAMARDALGIFEDSPLKQALLGIVDFCIRRAR